MVTEISAPLQSLRDAITLLSDARVRVGLYFEDGEVTRALAFTLDKLNYALDVLNSAERMLIANKESNARRHEEDARNVRGG